MQGGLFLFPLYVDTEDVVAADAREMVHPMAAEPVAGAETFNPQRMATLIRTANAGRLSTVGETTEIDADVLNSMPKWAQAVVQTGCFNAESARGLKASPSNKLKRRLELQNETEYEQPCKRQSVRNTTDDMSSMHDEGGELQNCLDELNAEHDVDVEVEDKAETPALPTQAEITAYSVEKYAELLVKLVDVAMYRQQQEDFELGDQDVFSSDEVKLLLQSLKAMENNDWINKLEPELLISLMSAFDTQVQLGLTLDVLAAMMPSNEEKMSHLCKPNGGLVQRLIASLDVAICELIVMTTPQIDRRILSEETINNCFLLLHHIIRRLLLPCIDTTFATTASARVGNEKYQSRSTGGKTSSSSRVNLRTNKNIREAVSGVTHVVCELMDHLATLVLGVKLADRWLLPLSSSMVELFTLEYSTYATSLQQSGLVVLRNIFLQYPTHRDSLLADIVGVMVKLPTTKRTLRTMKLLNSVEMVQQISTVAVSMIQSCAPAVKVGTAEADVELLNDSIEPSSTPDTVTDEKSQQQNGTVAAVLDETRKSAQSFVGKLLAACWKRSEERDNRVVLDNFVEDLLEMFVRPEWVGAEELLEVLSSSLASILHANISKEGKSPDSHYSLAALNLVGKMCASIKRYQKEVGHSGVKDDSDAVAIVEEHMSTLRTAIIGKKTRSRSALPRASIQWCQQMALKHIVVMHLQRHNFGQSDSKKLLLLKFMSELDTHWGSAESVYRERERKLWDSLWEMRNGGVGSIFKVAAPTNELALKSSLHLAVKRGFCGLFDSLLAHVMALLSKGIPTLRARVMKCLRGIVDVDPMLMAEVGVQTAVQMCCSDEKPSVREAAVDLIGTYVLLQPLLFDKYFDALAERLRDKGIKVRKSVCKIFKVVLISMQNRSGDAISEQELRRKSACMKCLVERIGDAAEDQGVKNFIIDTFQEVWFGAELAFSRLSNPLGEFGDGSNLPPGWAAVASTSDEKGVAAPISQENVKFVSEGGNIANSVEEAWSAYRTPTVAPSSVVKIIDSKMDNTSEVVATIVEVIHGMPNFSWFVELLKRLLEERTDSTRKKVSRSSKNEAEIAQDRSEKIVGGLVACLMDLQEGKLLQGVSIEEGHLQFVSCMKALTAFCEAKPQILACHIETLRVYLKEDDFKIQRLAVSMIDHILSVKRPPQSLANKLEDDLRLLVLGSPPSVVDPSVKCLATLSSTRKMAPVLLLKLLEQFSLIMRDKLKESLTTLSEKDNYVLQRALFAAGKIVGATDIDRHKELTNEAKLLKIGAITELLYEWYREYVRKPGNDACAGKAVQGMGFLFPIRPRLFLRAQQDGLLKFLLTAAPGKLTLHCLVSMKELLLYEEQRLGNGLATQRMDRSKSKEQQVQGDQEADASLIGNVMQAELGNVLLLSLHKVAQIRQEAVGCIGALLTQGLVNPLQCIPNLVALETDGVLGVRDAAFSQLLAVYERFPSQFLTPSIKGIRDSYSFQLRVFGTATASRPKKDEKDNKEFCLFGRLYTTCLKSTRFVFLQALVNQFTAQGSVLKTQNKPASANSSITVGNLKYLCYLAQIIAALPYEVENEPLYIIYLINRYASLRLGPVLDDLRETFAKAGVAADKLEDDESNLSQVDIDKYRPLSPLTGSELAALETNGCTAFALALMLHLKLALKANYKLDNEKCATYKHSTADKSVEVRERSPKKLLLPSVDDFFHAEDPIQINWNLFMTAWLVARKDQAQLDFDLETEKKPKERQLKLKTPPKRRRRSRRAAVKQQVAESDSADEDENVEGFA